MDRHTNPSRAMHTDRPAGGPDIVLVQTDQHMATALGCYGNPSVRTPNIDAIAAGGVRFTGAYCASPICTPARASLQTGLLPCHHGMTTNIYTRGCMVHELADDPSLLSRRLQSCGYSTGFTGKWHLGFGPEPEKEHEWHNHIRATPTLSRVRYTGCLPSTVGYEGDDFPGHGGVGIGTRQYKAWLASRGKSLERKMVFDQYPHTYEVTSGPDTTVTHFLTERAIGKVTEFAARPGNFFYFLNYWGPHADYHAPSEFVDLYRDVPIPEWASFREPQDRKPKLHDAHRAETIAHWTWADYERAIRIYYASITEIDHHVGRLLATLKALGRWDNTVLIFTADHGDSLGVHSGLTDKSLFMYEETNRIPLLICGPGVRRGAIEDRFAGTCDLYSTVLDYAGVDRATAELDGRSLRPLIEGSPVPWRDQIVTEASGLDFIACSQRALRWSHYKYVFNAGDTDELYDLAADSHEMENLAFDPTRSALLREGRERLDRWLAENNDGLRERYRRMRGLNV